MTPVAAKKSRKFNTKTFLSTINDGRKIVAFAKKQTIFAQGDPCRAVFYIRKGKVKLTVVSKTGKEATIGVLNDGDFFGEGCLTGQPLRLSSATAMIDCSVMRIEKKSMVQVILRERGFSNMFVAYLLTRNIRYEADLVDPAFQFQREKAGSNIAFAGSHRQGRYGRDCNPPDESGDPRRDGGYNSLPSQFLHE
jgi:CRP/FNR family cyclic AMP-dependent transcriptional regulator